MENHKQIWKNVRLETGFLRDEFEITETQTALFVLVIQNGVIDSIRPNDPDLEVLDAHGALMLPPLKDMHIHLDKTYYGGKWKAKSTRQQNVKDMIALEQELLPSLLSDSIRRASLLIDLLKSKGSNFARSHVNIEPTSKLSSLNNLHIALEKHRDTFGCEIVAFPQHGILYTKSQSLMKEAVNLDVDYVGGLDPYSIDGAIEPSLDFMLQLALDHHKGIDLHLHETGESALKTINYLAKHVIDNPTLKGKVYISHAFVLAHVDNYLLEKIITLLVESEIGIATTIPIGKNRMPIPQLLEANVTVFAGTDSVVDHWHFLGTGSMLDKANRMAELYDMTSEFQLSRCLAIATGGLTPLDASGMQVWPKVGDEASFILCQVSCSAEAVARKPAIDYLVHKGNIVFQQ